MSTDHTNWQVNQCWLAEAIRMVTTLLYGEVLATPIEDDANTRAAVHKSAIVGQATKLFGALYDSDPQAFSVGHIIDLLVHIGDLGHISNGYHIPRESRIACLSQGWGRIAGGLPIELSEHPDDGIGPIIQNSLGRLVRLQTESQRHAGNTEYSDTLEWQTNTVEQTLANLRRRLSGRTGTRPPHDLTQYYNAAFLSGRSRRDRWHNKMPKAPFVVARTGRRPSHYYVLDTGHKSSDRIWFEIDREQARHWILLAERSYNTLNVIKADIIEESRRFFLPDMLPKAWTTAILSCASSVACMDDGGWNVTVHQDAMEPLLILLRIANIELL